MVLVIGVGSGGNHLGLTVAADGSRVRKALTTCRELLLGEPERGVEEPVEILLRLGRGVVAPRGHRSADAAGESLEAGLGDEGVDEAEDEFAVVVAELVEAGEAVAEAVFG